MGGARDSGENKLEIFLLGALFKVAQLDFCRSSLNE